MLTQFRWCISVALSLDTQLVVSKPYTMLPSLARRVPLAESEPKRQLLLPSHKGTMAHCRRIAITFTESCAAQRALSLANNNHSGSCPTGSRSRLLSVGRLAGADSLVLCWRSAVRGEICTNQKK
jgi:hypothetical protein